MVGGPCGRSRWRGRPATLGRSARPRTGRDGPRCSGSSRVAAVQLGREESRRRPEDLACAAQLAVLAFQLGDALLLGGGHAGPLAGVDLGLAGPVAKGLTVDAELVGDAGD